MPEIGYVNVHAYESYAQIPLKSVAIEITSPDGTPLGMRLTDSSGKICPVAMEVPDASESQLPDPDKLPYALVNLNAYLDGYEMITVENIQVFAGNTTIQDLEMVPLSIHADEFDNCTDIDTPPQDL